jgi:hypothetical protein
MSKLSGQYSDLNIGDYREIGTPEHIVRQLPDGVKVRTFVTPSHTTPGEGYYLQAVKGNRKAGWGNGTATIVCNCIDGLFKSGLVLSGIKTPCKHADLLRHIFRGDNKPWMEIDG